MLYSSLNRLQSVSIKAVLPDPTGLQIEPTSRSATARRIEEGGRLTLQFQS